MAKPAVFCCQKPISITTRIKTEPPAPIMTGVVSQKPISITTRIKTSIYLIFYYMQRTVRNPYPLQQGLRRASEALSVNSCLGQKPISITTRIKTDGYIPIAPARSVRNPYPLQQGLRHLTGILSDGKILSETHIHYNKD